MKIPTNPCLLRNEHKAHYWWYTDEGGGHMVSPDFVDPTEHFQHWCLGLDHVARHRGYPTPKWTAPKTPYNYRGRHRA